MVDILLRRRQNNPLLTGDAGVGKTAIVEGLALAIAAGSMPPALSQVSLLSLDIVALSAGASMKGEFEARLKSVLDEAIAAEKPVILFIDEVHTYWRGWQCRDRRCGELIETCIGAWPVTYHWCDNVEQFKRHIEKDPALTRRFQVLR